MASSSLSFAVRDLALVHLSTFLPFPSYSTSQDFLFISGMTMLVPISRPLHLLAPLPGTHFPRSSQYLLPQFIPLCLMSCPQRGSLESTENIVPSSLCSCLLPFPALFFIIVPQLPQFHGGYTPLQSAVPSGMLAPWRTGATSFNLPALMLVSNFCSIKIFFQVIR